MLQQFYPTPAHSFRYELKICILQRLILFQMS